MPSYGLTSYWEERYASTEAAVVEWLLSPEDLLKAAPELAKPTHKDMQILVLGCGSSMLPTNLANAGWSRVHCIDASSALISCLSTRYQHQSAVTLSTEDATQLRCCEEGSFAVAVDKGLTDALLCSAQGLNAVRKMLSGVHAALQQEGRLVILSKCPPQQLKAALDSDPAADNLNSTADAAAARSVPTAVPLHTPAAAGEKPVAVGAWQVSHALATGKAETGTAVYLHVLQRSL